MNKLTGTMMWPKSMHFIVASIAKILVEDNENWRNLKKQMYFRRKPSYSAVSSQPAKPVSVYVTPRSNCRN